MMSNMGIVVRADGISGTSFVAKIRENLGDDEKMPSERPRIYPRGRERNRNRMSGVVSKLQLDAGRFGFQSDSPG